MDSSQILRPRLSLYWHDCLLINFVYQLLQDAGVGLLCNVDYLDIGGADGPAALAIVGPHFGQI